jgi:hypothetical protein
MSESFYAFSSCVCGRGDAADIASICRGAGKAEFGAGPLAISVPDLADELRCPELARRWCQWSELLVRLGEAGLGA